MTVICDYCGQPAKLVGGKVMYPHRPDLFSRWFWQCQLCDAMVGCHQKGCAGSDGTKPLGRLANAELRKAKQAAHAALDPLWRSGEMGRREAYSWLTKALGLPRGETHIGMMDVAGCRAVIAAVQARKPAPGADEGGTHG